MLTVETIGPIRREHFIKGRAIRAHFLDRPPRCAAPAKQLLRSQGMPARNHRHCLAALMALGNNPRLCSALHVRRRPAPVNTSNRRTASGLDLGKSSVSDTCLTCSTQQL